MVGNLAFTLYEVFGYLLPGGITFIAFAVLYWASFVARMPLGIADFQAGLVTWVAVTITSYVLGHAVQGVGNICFHGMEGSVLDSENGSAPLWMRECARKAAAGILDVGADDQIESRWLFRVLDEFALQSCKDGDREIFVYREGFYKGTSLSLFLLSAALLVRMVVPGACISFTKGPFQILWYEVLVTAAIVGGVAFIFVRRWQRFADYRITRAVLAALVAQKALEHTKAGGGKI